MKKKRYDFVGGQNQDNSWMGCAIPLVVLFLLAGFAIMSYFIPWYEKITLK